MKMTFINTCMSTSVFIVLMIVHINATSQENLSQKVLSANTGALSAEEAQSKKAWTVFGEDGSVQFSAETVRLLTDAEYRSVKYPKVYDAIQVADLLDTGDVPFALWTIINLFKGQPDQVKVIAFKLAEYGIRGDHYLNAFYTYAFADPEVMDYTDADQPNLGHPQQLEEKLWSCRTIAAYTDKVIETRTRGK